MKETNIIMDHDKKRNVSMVNIFKMYDYKSQDPYVVAGRNYIPKEDRIEGHKFSLTIKQWKEIMAAIFDYYIDEMIAGHTVELPYNWGSLKLIKYRPRKIRPIDEITMVDGWRIGLKWKRNKFTPMAWALRMFWSDKFKHEVKRRVDEKKFIINYLEIL